MVQGNGSWSAELNVTEDLMSTGLAVWCQNSKETMGNTLLDQSLASGTWSGRTMASCPAVQSAPAAPPMAGHAVSLQPKAHQARAHTWQPRAGRSGHRHHNRGPACRQEPGQPAPTHHPNFTWKHSHVHMDATALQSAINSHKQHAAYGRCGRLFCHK